MEELTFIRRVHCSSSCEMYTYVIQNSSLCQPIKTLHACLSTLPPTEECRQDLHYDLAYEWPIDAVTVADLGSAVVSILDHPEKYIGKKIGISGNRMTMAEYAAIIAEATGKKPSA